MKKIFFLIFCICLAITSYASVTDTYQFEYTDQNITVVFEETSNYTIEERQYLADILTYGNFDTESSSTYSWCWLTGHDITSECVAVIEHKVFNDAPRCKRTLYQIDSCSNCDHVETTELSHSYIDCCPEDSSET